MPCRGVHRNRVGSAGGPVSTLGVPGRRHTSGFGLKATEVGRFSVTKPENPELPFGNRGNVLRVLGPFDGAHLTRCGLRWRSALS